MVTLEGANCQLPYNYDICSSNPVNVQTNDLPILNSHDILPLVLTLHNVYYSKSY